MSRKISIMVLVLFSFLLFSEGVFAKEYILAGSDTETCEYILGDIKDEESLAHFLQDVFNVIKYGGPILCIVLSILEFIKAVPSEDKDMLFKATKRTAIRIALALVLFFVPTFINFVFGLLGWMGTCGIS